MTHSQANKQFKEWLKDLAADNANVFQIIYAYNNKQEEIDNIFDAKYWDDKQAQDEAIFEAECSKYWDDVENGLV